VKNYSYICFLVVVLIALSCDKQNQDIVAWVNNEAITTAELKHWMLLEKANVFNYFHWKHGVDDSDNFWIQKLGNEIPLEKLKETALEQAKRCKVQQIIALEKGIIETANFDEVIGEMKKVNAERKMKVRNGEPIYGPVEFTSRTYFFHVFDKMQIELKNELAKNELKPSHEELNRMKNNHSNATKDVTGFLTMQYADKNYDSYIDQQMKELDVEINEIVYNNIRLN